MVHTDPRRSQAWLISLPRRRRGDGGRARQHWPVPVRMRRDCDAGRRESPAGPHPEVSGRARPTRCERAPNAGSPTCPRRACRPRPRVWRARPRALTCTRVSTEFVDSAQVARFVGTEVLGRTAFVTSSLTTTVASSVRSSRPASSRNSRAAIRACATDSGRSAMAMSRRDGSSDLGHLLRTSAAREAGRSFP